MLFNDRFLLAVPADDPLPERSRVRPSDVKARRLVLLEEGHCLRDQALVYCGDRDTAHTKLGATSLATVLQMVASGYGVTLLPEVAVDVEVRDERVKLLRFIEPQPRRKIGLAWRSTSPRKADFLELGQILLRTLKCEQSHRTKLQTSRQSCVRCEWRTRTGNSENANRCRDKISPTFRSCERSPAKSRVRTRFPASGVSRRRRSTRRRPASLPNKQQHVASSLPDVARDFTQD